MAFSDFSERVLVLKLFELFRQNGINKHIHGHEATTNLALKLVLHVRDDHILGSEEVSALLLPLEVDLQLLLVGIVVDVVGHHRVNLGVLNWNVDRDTSL